MGGIYQFHAHIFFIKVFRKYLDVLPLKLSYNFMDLNEKLLDFSSNMIYN